MKIKTNIGDTTPATKHKREIRKRGRVFAQPDLQLPGHGSGGIITDAIDSTSSQTFSYDDLGRLTAAAGKYGSYGFQYDKVGNRRSQTLGQTVTNYSFAEGSNRLSQINSAEIIDYQYDEAGNPLSKGDQSFTWNQNDRLISLSDNGTEAGQYDYDAQGLRTVKTTAEGAVLSLYDSAGNLLAETDADGHTIREFVYLDGLRLTLFDYSLLPEFTVTVTTAGGTALEKVRVYGFDENDRYTGNYGTTNDQGKAGFDRDMFGEGSYTFRVDYLGARFWTPATIVQNSNGIQLIIENEPVEISVITDGQVKPGVKVYAFTESGTYLGVYGITDENGKVSFSLPEGQNYKFRADLFGNQYWSDSSTIVAGGSGIVLNSFGGTLQLTLQEADSLPLQSIKTYLFSAGGSYLGLSGTSAEDGTVSYRVADGSYKIRADYLGYQFWSEDIVIAKGAAATTLAIAHQDVTWTVQADLAGFLSPLAKVNCYLFSPAGAYLGRKSTTSATGAVSFHVPDQPFRVRADYLGGQFWSEDSLWQDSSIAIAHGTAVIEVSKMGSPLDNIKVYAFTGSGSYLNLNSLTKSDGRTSFLLPAGEFRFRADYQGSQY
jgi:YD repeat-containing protein